MTKDNRDKNEKDGGKHENEDEKRNGQPTGPIDPDTIREPPPGKRGQ